MQLTMRRSQGSSGLLTKSVKFVLEAKVSLTPAETEHVEKYKMGSEIIYSKDRLGYNPHGNDSAGGMLRNVAAIAAAITLTVNDLVRGHTIECKDILEMSAICEQIKQACATFKMMLDEAAGFEGEEVIDY